MLFVLLGLFTGFASGLIGIGGGVVLIPALVYFFGFNQHLAQGTSLAMMIPPIGILAAMEYYKSGNIDVKVAGFLIIGFVIGGLFGAKLALCIPKLLMKRIFGIALLLIGMKMVLVQ